MQNRTEAQEQITQDQYDPIMTLQVIFPDLPKVQLLCENVDEAAAYFYYYYFNGLEIRPEHFSLFRCHFHNFCNQRTVMKKTNKLPVTTNKEIRNMLIVLPHLLQLSVFELGTWIQGRHQLLFDSYFLEKVTEPIEVSSARCYGIFHLQIIMLYHDNAFVILIIVNTVIGRKAVQFYQEH